MLSSLFKTFLLIASLFLSGLFMAEDAQARPGGRGAEVLWKSCLPPPGTYEKMAVTAEAKQDLPRLLEWYRSEFPKRPYFAYPLPTERSRFSCRTMGPVNWGNVNWFYQSITGLRPRKCENASGCTEQGVCRSFGDCTVNSMRVCSLDYVVKPGEPDNKYAHIRTPSGRTLGKHGCAPDGTPTELPFP